MENQNQVIEKAAIQYQGNVYTGWRHHTIGLDMVNNGDCPRPFPSGDKQGFVTNDGVFVDRKTAYDIAKKAGQLIQEFMDGKSILFSEMLWYSNGTPIHDISEYGKAAGLVR